MLSMGLLDRGTRHARSLRRWLPPPVLDLGRTRCPRAAGSRRRATHRVGGQEPIPPVPQRSRLPASRCRGAWRWRAGGRAASGKRERRPRLGARPGRTAVRRPRRQAAGILRPRRRTRELSGAARPPVGVTLAGTLPANEGCAWSFDDGDGHPRQVTGACDEEVKARLVSNRPTIASVDVVLTDGTALRLVSEIVVHDALIAGTGDSIAAGEGNPDQAVRLSDQGFCFKRFGGGEYYRPGRASFSGNKSCATMANEDTRAGEWAQQSARWLSGPCHRSLYSYQMRTALALAIENLHLAVTFLPLGCSGATINAGFLNNQRARECPSPGTGAPCSGTVRAQVAELTELLAAARRHQTDRKLDLVLLTIGANDIFFSGLIANVMLEPGTERSLLYRGGIIASVEDAQKVLDRELPGNF